MKNIRWAPRLALVTACGLCAGLMAARLQAVPGHQAAAVATPMTAMTLSPNPPKGAIVLISGKQDELTANFYKRYSKDPSTWTIADGMTSPNGSDAVTKQEFGDCYVHAEWLEPTDAAGKTMGEGNSGIGLEGRYEVQILDSFGKEPGKEDCGAFYSLIAPLVNASKKPSEWQTYDIIFRAPRFDATGAMTEKPRATVFQNGIIVQNNTEFPGMTGIQYNEYKTQTKTGPLVLQGDHDPVHFRNVWVVPL